ncbi:MAG: GNAT family N-acetyltransferase [Promethearchaeota archaeon]
MKAEHLEDGLTMRNATERDIPALLEHFKVVHGVVVVDQLRTMLERYPRFSWEDSFIIEDIESGKVVSCVILLQNSWVLNGIEFPSVEMEAVGTLESHRYRGLIRLLNERFDERAAQLQPVIMTIAGIPYFYRNFGYEFAARLGGGYPVNPSLMLKLKDGEEEPVTFELVDSGNFKEFLQFREKYLPSETWIRKIRPEDADYLIYETSSHDQEAFFFYLVKEKGKTVGVFFLARWEKRMDIVELYLDNHLHVDPVLRFALNRAQEWEGIPVRVAPPNQLGVREYVSARAQLTTMVIGRYAWYVKIPSISRFIETVSPLFPERLRSTEYHNFTGELTLTTYKEGFSITFEKGKFTGISVKEEREIGEYQLRIPMDSLTRLLMGYETLDELMNHEPDVQCAAPLRSLVRTLFPRLEAIVDPYY